MGYNAKRILRATVAELVDAWVSKTHELYTSCRFDSDQWHIFYLNK